MAKYAASIIKMQPVLQNNKTNNTNGEYYLTFLLLV